VKRFVWLAVALLIASSMLLYMRSQHVYAERTTAVPPTDLARPAEDRESLIAGLFQGALLHAEDGVDFAETPSYRRLLYHVRSMSPEEFSSRVTGRLDWADAVAHPDRWRGEFVRVRGVAASLEPVKLHGLDAGIEDVYRGFIGETDMSAFVAFDHVENPPPVRVTEAVKDVLDLEGVFYRTVKYESRTGEMRELPYLITRNLSIFQPAADRPSTLVLALQVVGIVAASVVVGLAVSRWTGRKQREKSSSAGIRELFEARLRQGGGPPGKEDKPS